jgi:Fe-S cluster biogenesis protein NfuA
MSHLLATVPTVCIYLLRPPPFFEVFFSCIINLEPRTKRTTILYSFNCVCVCVCLKIMKSVTILSLALAASSVSGFSIVPTKSTTTKISTSTTQLFEDVIVSPFDESNPSVEGDVVATTTKKLVGPLPLTWENVEAVLDEMRHYLIQDGGNVIISEIDGPVVKLELQGACGTCPSSTQTMKMGLERGLMEKLVSLKN